MNHAKLKAHITQLKLQARRAEFQRRVQEDATDRWKNVARQLDTDLHRLVSGEVFRDAGDYITCCIRISPLVNETFDVVWEHALADLKHQLSNGYYNGVKNDRFQ